MTDQQPTNSGAQPSEAFAAGRFHVLDDIGRSITSSLDLDVVLARIAEGAKSLCEADTAAIFLRDAEIDMLVPRYRAGQFPPGYEALRVRRGEGVGGQAWATERVVRSGRYLEDSSVPEHFRKVAEQSGTVAVMAVPIHIADRVEGILYLTRRSTRPLTADDESISVWLAHQAAIAIQNASVYKRERRLRAEAEIFAALATDLTAALGTDRVLRRVAQAAQTLANADVVRIALQDDGAEGMRYRYLVGTRAAGYERLQLLPGRGFVGRVLETGRPYRTNDAFHDAAVDPEYGRRFIEAEGVVTAMVIPVRIDGKTTGVIYTARRAPRPFTDDDEAITSRLADYAAIAIRNAEWFRREHAARAQAEDTERRASFLAQASALVTASLDLEATLRSIARLSVPYLADFCAIDMKDERGHIRRLVAVHSDPAKEGLVREVRERYGFKTTAPEGVPSVLERGRTAFVPNVSDEHLRAASTSDAQFQLLRELKMVSWIIVPLSARGRILGSITLVMAESGRRHTVADVSVAEDVGRRAAIAVDNAQLYAEAQFANRAKDEFLATLSHELRTPINAVYGWAHILRTTQPDADTTRRGLDAIERNAAAQVQLIEDLLDISRIVSGRVRFDVGPVDLGRVIEAAVDAVRPAADAKELRLEIVLDRLATPVNGDAGRLQQVVWNLLVNATKFTPRNGRVQITLRRSTSHVEIAVSDTGIGIAPDLLPQLFERFRQGDRTTGGLGIGLALVRHLVELHGGTVSVASAGVGQGSTFTVRLPA